MTAPARAEVRRVVLDVIAEILPGVPPEEITDDKNLLDLGADSVERVEIIVELQHRFGSTEPVSRFADVPDIGALVAFFDEAGRR
ncbi:acyl carrier protein [Micromonospora sp. NPDC002296]|uniref:acyl carrier protein n=1 Tax=Micromonospora sp. NPDC002296 TaxID=3154271 RepID=UPI00332001FF